MIDRVRGTIARRILLNYRIDPEVAAARLPAGFEPKLANGYALGGICLIRLEHARPLGVPRAVGLASENAAHRFAAYRLSGDTREDCVYIARRHSGSLVNTTFGRGLISTEQEPARFDVRESDGAIDELVAARDGTRVHVRARRVADLPPSAAFASLDAASAFFRGGSFGYSARRSGTVLDGLRLETDRWEITPLAVEIAESTYFDDRALFPEGSIELDCALLMTGVEHTWYRVPALRTERPTASRGPGPATYPR